MQLSFINGFPYFGFSISIVDGKRAINKQLNNKIYALGR
jgi:hypothetical protein